MRRTALLAFIPMKKKKKQKIRISVKLGLKKIGSKDTLKSTVSYDNIIDYLERVKSFPHINLVETLAKKIMDHFLKIKIISSIEIEIVKPQLLKKNTDVGFLLKKSIH